MGLHRILVELGISYATPKDAEMHIARYISKRFLKAAAIYIERNYRERKEMKFVDCLKIIWKEGYEDGRFMILDKFLAKNFMEVCGYRVRVTSHKSAQRGNALRRGGKFLWINIYTGHLESSQTEEQFKKEFHLLIGVIYHECDHIFEEGSDIMEDTYEKTFLYLTQKGEIRAHSKEYALHYHQAFPDVKFDFEKMKDLFEKAYGKKSKPSIVLGHLEIWRDPENYPTTNKNVKAFIRNRIVGGDDAITVEKCKRAYEAYIHFMDYFVNYFNKKKGHKIEV